MNATGETSLEISFSSEDESFQTTCPQVGITVQSKDNSLSDCKELCSNLQESTPMINEKPSSKKRTEKEELELVRVASKHQLDRLTEAQTKIEKKMLMYKIFKKAKTKLKEQRWLANKARKTKTHASFKDSEFYMENSLGSCGQQETDLKVRDLITEEKALEQHNNAKEEPPDHWQTGSSLEMNEQKLEKDASSERMALKRHHNAKNEAPNSYLIGSSSEKNAQFLGERPPDTICTGPETLGNDCQQTRQDEHIETSSDKKGAWNLLQVQGLVDFFPFILKHLEIEDICNFKLSSKQILRMIAKNEKLLRQKTIHYIKKRHKNMTNNFHPSFKEWTKNVLYLNLEEKTNNELHSIAATINVTFIKEKDGEVIENDFRPYPSVYHYFLMLRERIDQFKFVVTLANLMQIQNIGARSPAIPPNFDTVLKVLINSSKSKYLTWLEHEKRLKDYLSTEDLYQMTAKKLMELDRSLPIKQFMDLLVSLRVQYNSIIYACQTEEISDTIFYQLVKAQEKDDEWTQKRHVQFLSLIHI